MRAKETDDKLILQNTPGCFWLFGSFFIFVGAIFLYGSLGGVSNSSEVSWWFFPLAFLMSLCAIVVGFWFIFQSPSVRTVIDRRAQIVTVKRSNFFGSQTSSFVFADIKHFDFEESKNEDGNPIWRLTLVLENGSRVPLAAPWLNSRESEQPVLIAANQFIRQQIE